MNDSAPVEHLVVLEVESGPNATTRFELLPGVSTIGRRPDNTVVLHDPWMSGVHGTMDIESGVATYSDAGSRHGSSLERGGVSRSVHRSMALRDGDILRLGRTRLRVHVVDAWWRFERSTDLNPPPLMASVVSAKYASIDSLRHLITEADHRLAVVFALGEELASATTRSRVVDLTARAIFDAVSVADRVTAVWAEGGAPQIDDDHVERRTRTAKRTDEAIPAVSGGASMPLVMRAVASKQSLLVVADEDALDGEPSASVCVPLVVDFQTLGALQVDALHATARLDESDVELLAVFAHHVAAAVDRIGRVANRRDLFESFVEASVLAIEQRDPVTAGHSHRVTRYAMELLDVVERAQIGPYAETTFSSDERRSLRYAALLHDFGKIAVREEVLTKPRRLFAHRLAAIEARVVRSRDAYRACRWEALARRTAPGDSVAAAVADIAAWDRTLDEGLARIHRNDAAGRLTADDVATLDAFVADPRHPFTLIEPADLEALRIPRGTLTPDEWEQMRSHVEQSTHFLDRIAWGPTLQDVPTIAGMHHERLDGSGYPCGLEGDALDVRARILMIADMYDAMTAADRPYRDAITPARAVAILRDDAAHGRLDGDLVDLFERYVVPVIGPGSASTTAEERVV